MENSVEQVRVVSYRRVSTGEQADSGAGMEAQRTAIEADVARRGWVLVADETDAGFSGKGLAGRPGLQAALHLLAAGEADALVVSKLDRLSRSLLDFASLMATAQREGWNLVALDLGIDLSTQAGEFLAAVMASAAQWERRIIGQRTREALAVRRAEGVRLGRPPTIPDDIVDRIVAEATGGTSMAEIARRLTTDAVPTARGGAQWYPSTVQTVLRRTHAAS